MQVRDVMTEATVTDSTTDTLRSAAERMWREQTGSLLVLDGERLAGIITERDLLRAVALGADPAVLVSQRIAVPIANQVPEGSWEPARGPGRCDVSVRPALLRGRQIISVPRRIGCSLSAASLTRPVDNTRRISDLSLKDIWAAQQH